MKGLICSAVISLSFILATCSPDLSDYAIPYQPFTTITINLNLPEYNSLKTDGGSYSIQGGVRGILIYRKSASEYIAYEKNCSYQPNNACATVSVHPSMLYMIDDCCHSTFDFATGNPTGGPAWRPLRRYEALLSGTNLTITDQIIE